MKNINIIWQRQKTYGMLLFIFFFSLASSCEKDDVNVMLSDMAKFDEAFVPVLYYVQQDELDNAKRAVFFLNHSWQKLNRKYKNQFPENDDWNETFRMTDAWLTDAYHSINEMQQKEAYIFLDHVRYQMIELRSQNDLKYYLDEVWEFEASLDVAEEVAVDQMLCLLDYCEFEEIVDDLNEQWTVLMHKKVDYKLFEMDGDEIDQLQKQKKKLSEALVVFNQAVEEMEGENLAMTATFLRQAYLEYLANFGDFVSSKHYYASL